MAIPEDRALRHLRYFTAVAENLNFSEASHRIHVAQPAISQTILDLEEELGVRLLLRDRRTVQLTAPGETFRRVVGASKSQDGLLMF